jgi:hypothetical protein
MRHGNIYKKKFGGYSKKMHACIFENGKFIINKGFGGDRKV